MDGALPADAAAPENLQESPAEQMQRGRHIFALPSTALERIATFSDGPSMYNLALTAKDPFFTDYFGGGGARGTAFATRL